MTEERLQMIQKLHEEDKSNDSILIYKKKILDMILQDEDILELLDNKELMEQGATPEDYHDVNVFSYLRIPETQSMVKNYICFDVNDIHADYINNIMITKQVIFRCVCHKQDVKTPFGVDRQDLLAYCIKDNFQWNNAFGTVWKKEFDSGRIAENGFYYREIHFYITNANGLVNGVPRNGRN